MAAFLSMLGKKLTIDFFSDSEKTLKEILKMLLIPILIITLLIGFPIYVVVNLPSLLCESSLNNEISQQQIGIIALYHEAPSKIDQSNLSWIEEKKEEYSWCDDIVVNYDFDLVWQHLMSIDAVLLKQDFSNVSENEVLKLGYKFVIRNNTTEIYEEEISYNDTITLPDGTKITIPVKTTVTRTRAILTITTKPFVNVLNELNFDEKQKELASNIYDNIKNLDIEGNFNIYDDIKLDDLEEYPEGSANLPYYNQTDRRWGSAPYGNSTIASGGCGPTSLAMVVAGLTNNKVTPLDVANWSYVNGHRAEGKGSYWSLMTEGGKHYGLKVESVSRKNPRKIVEALSEGYPVIASMGRGHFTKGGHFIVLRGLTSDGKVLVHDPSSVKRTQQAWDLSIIMGESSTNGGVNGSPFWIYKP